MKRILSVFLVMLVLLSAGCAEASEDTPETSANIQIAALDEEPVPETSSVTEATTPTEATLDSEESNATLGRCVDCGSLITDPASFDPYHCVGCGNGVFFYCEHCWRFIPCVDSIHRMCVDCYWTSGCSKGFCVICGENLDIYVGNGMVCTDCYDYYGKNIHKAMLQPEPQECYLCRNITTSGAYLENGEFACVQCLNAPIPEYMGRCQTCGRFYADGEGFESLCFECQDKYGPKCSVCGTDCTYRGTIDGMCDDCYEASRMCTVCGATPGDYDGYCYYCHPDFGYTCSGCGRDQSEHRPASGLCWECRS